MHQKILLCMSVFTLVALPCLAQEVLPLYQSGAIPNALDQAIPEETREFNSPGGPVRFILNTSVPELTAYPAPTEVNTGIALVICPGGGYSGVAIDHEGHWVARKLNEAGISGFVLKYRTPNPGVVMNKDIVPLQDAQRALQMVREGAVAWGVDPNKVGIMGSSAGGHLASTAGTHFKEALIDNPKNTSLRPDFMVLNYPVISFADSLTHEGSRHNLIGQGQDGDKIPTYDTGKVQQYSNELQVGPDTPPAFVTHAVDDQAVKVQNSILFIAALQKNKVDTDSFFYAQGGHGYGMDNPTSEVDWMEYCIPWILDSMKRR